MLIIFLAFYLQLSLTYLPLSPLTPIKSSGKENGDGAVPWKWWKMTVHLTTETHFCCPPFFFSLCWRKRNYQLLHTKEALSLSLSLFFWTFQSIFGANQNQITNAWLFKSLVFDHDCSLSLSLSVCVYCDGWPSAGRSPLLCLSFSVWKMRHDADTCTFVILPAPLFAENEKKEAAGGGRTRRGRRGRRINMLFSFWMPPFFRFFFRAVYEVASLFLFSLRLKEDCGVSYRMRFFFSCSFGACLSFLPTQLMLLAPQNATIRVLPLSIAMLRRIGGWRSTGV